MEGEYDVRSGIEAIAESRQLPLPGRNICLNSKVTLRSSHMPLNAGFRYEREMLTLAADFLPAIVEPKFPNSFSVPEFYLQGIIPDMVFMSWDVDPCVPLNRRVTTVEAHVLNAVGRLHESSPDEIAQQLVFSSTRMGKTVSGLQKLGLIEVTAEGALRLAKPLTETTEIIAIEMKLRDWRKALDQACGYSCFADRSYVVLDGLQVRRSEEMESSFIEAGVGLIFQHGYQLEPVIDARPQSPESPLRYIAVQKLMLKRHRMITVSRSAAIS